ncbi:hypothetical protein L6164_016207 [Bauhinia variegata]|uniref:Uncharacterized protein n=1 Tax=Bauhinia variegata TaxID=167791 RepID=A0ACB9NN64_BAUVA|nr:hypothetical protein L6164_016207 [Bauhinia variegata]
MAEVIALWTLTTITITLRRLTGKNAVVYTTAPGGRATPQVENYRLSLSITSLLIAILLIPVMIYASDTVSIIFSDFVFSSSGALRRVYSGTTIENTTNIRSR